MTLLRSESYKKGIIFSTGFNFVAKLITFSNSVIIAFYFGTQTNTDIYFYAIATISLLIGFTAALDHSVIIPESIRIREQENEKKSQHFLTFFLYVYLAIGIAAIGILSINPVKIFLSISKFDEQSLMNNIELLYWIIPLCVLMLTTTYLADILASYKYFTLPMIASVINSILSILFVILFHDILELRSIVLGITIGYLMNIALLLSIMFRQLHWNFEYNSISLVKRVLHDIGYAQAGNLTSLLASYIPLYLLSGFNAGIITALNYGRNVSEIPNQIISSQFSVVSGIKFNELCARKEFAKLNDAFLSTTKFLLFILVPISGLFFLFSEEIITLFFKRGCFNDESVKLTALFLKYMGLSLSYFAINTMISRLFMSAQKIKHSFWYQIIMSTIFVSIIYFFIKEWGIIGYLSGILVYQVLVVFSNLYLTNWGFKMINYKSILKFLCFMLVINVSIIIPIKIVKEILPSNYFFIIGECLLYLILIFSINLIFRIEPQSISLAKSLIHKCKLNKSP